MLRLTPFLVGKNGHFRDNKMDNLATDAFSHGRRAHGDTVRNIGLPFYTVISD